MADLLKAKVLYFHVPGAEKTDYMVPTWQMMNMLRYNGWSVVDIVTRRNSNDMAEGLVKEWGTDDRDIIIIGQDNVCPEMQLVEMLDCPRPVCAIPCLMAPNSTDRKGLYLNQISYGEMHPADSKAEFVEGDPWYLGTGICCIKNRAQKASKKWIDPGTCYYQAFDTGITKALDRAGYRRGHLHYPIHRHVKAELAS